jgi:hypothetical protein
VHLLGHLRKNALLPVVVFTFSKKRCEENAATLTNADLSTALEKSEVHITVEKALSRLKGDLLSIYLISKILEWRTKVRTKSYLRSAACVTCYPAESVCTTVDCYLSSKRFVQCIITDHHLKSAAAC